MTVYLIPLLATGALVSCGVYLLLERTLTRMLLGLLLIGNAVNLLIIAVSGPPGNPPVRGAGTSGTPTADPLAQAMVLTAIVITMGVAAFVLALAYRSYRLTAAEAVAKDAEDTRVAQLSPEEAADVDADPEEPYPDTDEPDELDALPGHRGSR
ncbi:Na(+)/H(+) antiporter subunit C [Mycobacterium branderi]|uniref:Na(+)/H(+) antiporter subunit C n=1 Tax=Mycobacterium branderi TaxID=43348 RepID=A0A7I7W2B9_9MYCO|nr:Na(+)/H(+) antiporter subunit C [Mycobacterium branderi]MCV7236157.1 Na(+)/H(+) antiporter subunit C [Mycobacterium branderi]ORA32039.1 Na(+)/H(+) antiporter subunit C [Mycobacterium branderi]BBZ10811.1 Na(+)/H(+) antiporter subunit C [Mycobacterium branderi]